MSPEEAGAALRADPTFATMTRAEQEAEAALVIGGFATPSDDPLDIALAIEAALSVPSETAAELAAITAGTVEGCRFATDDDPLGCRGREPIAANGRCLSCGAYRQAPETPHTALVEPEAPEVPPKPVSRASAAPAAVPLYRGVKSDAGATLLGRFKEATGCTDRETGELIGMSRATVQAYASRRLPEKFDEAQARVMIDDLAARLLLLAELKRDLHIEIGEIE